MIGTRRAPQSGTATLDYGQLISAAAARRIACDRKLIPVVIGSNGEPLDVAAPNAPSR